MWTRPVLRLKYKGEQERNDLYRHVACILVEEIDNKHVNQVVSDFDKCCVEKRINRVVKETHLL